VFHSDQCVFEMPTRLLFLSNFYVTDLHLWTSFTTGHTCTLLY